MTHREKAIELFCSGYNCAQAVFCAYSEDLNIDMATARNISSSFGGGMGKLRQACGAFTGALMVAGAICGGYDVNDNDKKSAHYALVRRIAEEFIAINETINCEELLQGIANAKGKDPAERTPEYYATRPCARFVGDACDILDRVIEEKKL